jgi:hypothetical protein
MRTAPTLLVVCVAVAGCSAHRIGPANTDATTKSADVCASDSGSTVTAADLNACFAQGSAEVDCLDGLFHGYLADHSTTDALSLLQCLMDNDSGVLADCHAVSHAIGRETIRIVGTVDAAFRACNETCSSGCYHGAMERFLRGDSSDTNHITLQEIETKAVSACDPTLDKALLFQCLHGLGHAIEYASGYALRPSLSICDELSSDFAQSSCWGGVFMENLVSASPDVRDVSPTDPLYPCDDVDDRYRDQCYLNQTSRMFDMGLDPAKILDACRGAGTHAEACVQSLGRDISNGARTGQARTVSSTCELAQAELRAACSRGVVYALIDNTWDAQYAFPYCTTYADPSDVASCYAASVSYLRDVFAMTSAAAADQCAKWVPGDDACTRAAQ